MAKCDVCGKKKALLSVLRSATLIEDLTELGSQT